MVWTRGSRHAVGAWKLRVIERLHGELHRTRSLLATLLLTQLRLSSQMLLLLLGR